MGFDIPFGQIRTRVGGGSAGHNRIKFSHHPYWGWVWPHPVSINSEHRVKNDEKDFVLKEV